MKLLVDISQICYRCFFADMRENQEFSQKNIGFFKHLVISSILMVKKKYVVASSDIYLCADHKITWRKQIFSYYKANRKKTRDASKIDFQQLYDMMNLFYVDLKNVFPFHFIQTKYAEGDDCIGCLAQHFSESGEDFVIISSDSDFVQLHSLPGFRGQFDTIGKNVRGDKPKKQLFVKILNGDPGDGIPNVLSDDDTFVNDSKRQKPLGEKKAFKILSSNDSLKEFLEDKNIARNFKRNRRLIDLSRTPVQIKEKILKKYFTSNPKLDTTILYAYFHGHEMNILKNRVNEF